MAADSVVRVVGEPRFELVRRSPTLDGNIPLRAARACAPLLAANALGWILRMNEPLRVRRGLRSVTTNPVVRRARIVSGDHVELTLEAGFWLDHAIPGVGLIVERAYNLRDRRVDVVPVRADHGEPFELVLRVRLARADGEVTLVGDLASLTPIVMAPPVQTARLADALDVAEAHLAFFDADYFARKRGGPTRRYRTRAESASTTREDLHGVLVVHGGGAAPRVGTGANGELEITLPAELAASLTFEGLRVVPTLDARALERRASAIEATWRAAFGASIDESAGALRYFTTYVTPHAPGDPHVFWKPATLVATSPDLALIADGPTLAGLEGMRGMIESHWFHALPAVAHMIAPRAHVAAGERLVRARFTPRGKVLRLER